MHKSAASRLRGTAFLKSQRISEYSSISLKNNKSSTALSYQMVGTESLSRACILKQKRRRVSFCNSQTVSTKDNSKYLQIRITLDIEIHLKSRQVMTSRWRSFTQRSMKWNHSWIHWGKEVQSARCSMDSPSHHCPRDHMTATKSRDLKSLRKQERSRSSPPITGKSFSQWWAENHLTSFQT